MPERFEIYVVWRYINTLFPFLFLLYYAELAVYAQRWPKRSPVLIAPTHGGMARLSSPGWLVTYRAVASHRLVGVSK